MKNLRPFDWTIWMFLIFCLCNTTIAQVKGIITDQSTGEKLKGASVSVSHRLVIISNSAGMFEAQAFPGDTLEISFVGYQTKHIPVTANESLLRIGMEAYNGQLSDIIITGVFDPRKRIESSIAITTIPAARLEHIVSNSSSEVLRLVPGVLVQSARGELNNQIFSRGMVLDGTTYFISMQEDGLPVLSGMLGSQFSGAFLRVDANLDRIEAVRGGSASVLALNAPGGIFNYLSKTGSNYFEGHVSSRIGLEGNCRNPYARIDLNIGGPLSNRDSSWTYNIGGHYRYANGPKYPGYPLSRGGQIKGNLSKVYASGSLRLYIKWLNDRSKSFEFTPTMDFDKPRPAGHFTNSSSVLIDGIQLTIPSIGESIRGINYNSKDLDHLKDNSISLHWEQRFGDGSWKMNHNVRFSGKSSTDVGTFIVYPSDVSSFYFSAIFDLLGKSGQYRFINAANKKYYGTLTQDFNQPNPLTFSGTLPGGDIISNGVFFSPLTYEDNKLTDFFYQGTISKKYKNMHFTAGFYSNKTRYVHYGTQAATSFSTIEDKPQLLSIEYTPDNGGPVQQVTNSQGVGWYGWSPFGVQYNKVNLWDNSIFFGHQWDINSKLNLDWGMRYEWLHLTNYFLTTRSYETSASGGLDNNPQTLYDNYVGTLESPANYSKNASTYSFSGGLNYRLSKNLAFYVRYSAGNKIPDINTYISNQKAGNIVNELPLKTIQLEGGLKYQTAVTAITITPFLSILSNIPLTGFGQNAGANGTFYSLPVLYNKVHAAGIELETHMEFNRWSVKANAVLQKFVSDRYQYWDVRGLGSQDDTVIDRSGKKISFFAAPYIFNITPAYQFKKVYAGINWYCLAKRAANSNEAFYLPSYSQFDLNLGYKLSARINLKLSINNLLNNFGIVDWTAPVTDGIFFNTFNTAILSKETIKANPHSVYYTMGIQPRSIFLEISVKL